MTPGAISGAASKHERRTAAALPAGQENRGIAAGAQEERPEPALPLFGQLLLQYVQHHRSGEEGKGESSPAAPPRRGSARRTR